ncbi:MAG: hypothetical protein ACI8TF_000688 [Paracoccaceae bacterium]|jgi:hypothetical protein
MRRILMILAMIVTAQSAFAQAAEIPNLEINAAIQGQLDAFLAGDVNGAWDFAGPNIQGMFQTPERFGAMVQNGYPMVWRPTEVDYLVLREVAGNLWQRVQIVDAQGIVHLLDYMMTPTASGWKISAVQLLRAPSVGA